VLSQDINFFGFKIFLGKGMISLSKEREVFGLKQNLLTYTSPQEETIVLFKTYDLSKCKICHNTWIAPTPGGFPLDSLNPNLSVDYLIIIFFTEFIITRFNSLNMKTHRKVILKKVGKLQHSCYLFPWLQFEFLFSHNLLQTLYLFIRIRPFESIVYFYPLTFIIS